MGGLVAATFGCLARYLCYIVPFAGLLVLAHFTLNIPRELFRKMLHAAAFSSIPVVMWLSRGYDHACLVSVCVLVLFGALVWPALALAERLPFYADLFVERRLHEVRRSLLILFWGDALIVALAWGVFGRAEVAVTSILMWGFGDAAAALVGKRWGRHKTGLSHADPAKTWEGSGAMAVTSLAMGILSRLAQGALQGMFPLVAVFVAAVFGAYVELVTKRGNDTITVPLAHMVALLLFDLIG